MDTKLRPFVLLVGWLVDGRHLAIVIVVLLSDAACMVCVSMPLSTARTGRRRRRSFEREILDMML